MSGSAHLIVSGSAAVLKLTLFVTRPLASCCSSKLIESPGALKHFETGLTKARSAGSDCACAGGRVIVKLGASTFGVGFALGVGVDFALGVGAPLGAAADLR